MLISDDCSSINSSPWSAEHFRKQSMPKHSKVLLDDDHSFILRVSPLLRAIRKKAKVKRNPYYKIKGPTGVIPKSSSKDKEVKNKVTVQNTKITVAIKKVVLEKRIKSLGEKRGVHYEDEVTIEMLFEKPPPITNELADPTFISPRKRYLRQMECDIGSYARKKVHSGLNNLPHLSESKPSSSISFSVPHTSAINSQSSSKYSIDSILSEPVNKKKENYLRTLLKPDVKPLVPNSKVNSINDRNVNNQIKHERIDKESVGVSGKETKDGPSDAKRRPEPFEAGRDLGVLPPGLASFYLNQYFHQDPRYMMLQSLSAPPGLVPPTTTAQNDVASALAAAAAGNYSVPSPLHLSGLPGVPLGLLPGSLPTPYVPSTCSSSLAAQMMRSPSSTARSSPYPLPHSPSPKSYSASHSPSPKPYPLTHSPSPSIYPPVAPVPYPSSVNSSGSPRGGSPWHHTHSPHKVPSPTHSPPQGM